MKGERRVLENRVEAIAFDGHGIEPGKRVGGHHDKEKEGKADGTLHRQHPGPQGGRQVFAEDCHGATEACENEDP